jgi:hypothetical protein
MRVARRTSRLLRRALLASSVRTVSSLTPSLVVPPATSRPPPVKHFINLSNGIEALELLSAAGLPVEHVCFCRVQSSQCESGDFQGILTNLDHNLMMHLALGLVLPQQWSICPFFSAA